MTPSTVLLATDLDRRTDRAMDRAVALAREWQARLVIAHAIETTSPARPHGPPRDPRELAAQRIRADLGEPHAALELVIEPGNAVRVTLDAIRRHDARLVVTGVGKSSGFGRVSAGATIDALARLSPVPVLVVKARPHRPYRRIFVATDFSEPSREALRTALDLFPSAQVTLFHAFHVLYESFMDDKTAARDAEARVIREKATEFLAVMNLGDQHVEIRSVHGTPGEALRELAEAGDADLIVVGTRGRGGLGQLFLGSVTRSIVAEVPIDVLVASNRRMSEPVTR